MEGVGVFSPPLGLWVVKGGVGVEVVTVGDGVTGLLVEVDRVTRVMTMMETTVRASTP